MNTRFERLSYRQTQVFQLTCRGLRNAEIAQQTGLSTRSVKAYLGQLFLIFEVSNRTELVGL